MSYVFSKALFQNDEKLKKLQQGRGGILPNKVPPPIASRPGVRRTSQAPPPVRKKPLSKTNSLDRPDGLRRKYEESFLY